MLSYREKGILRALANQTWLVAYGGHTKHHHTSVEYTQSGLDRTSIEAFSRSQTHWLLPADSCSPALPVCGILRSYCSCNANGDVFTPWQLQVHHSPGKAENLLVMSLLMLCCMLSDMCCKVSAQICKKITQSLPRCTAAMSSSLVSIAACFMSIAAVLINETHFQATVLCP